MANHVGPHITLVFPFDSELDTQTIKNHLESVLKNVKPFKLSLESISRGKGYGYYMFLDVKQGIESVREIHHKLNSGLLKQYYPPWLQPNTFVPHMTIGNFTCVEDLDKALDACKHFTEKFETMVNCISVEVIDEEENSIIEIEHSLIERLNNE